PRVGANLALSPLPRMRIALVVRPAGGRTVAATMFRAGISGSIFVNMAEVPEFARRDQLAALGPRTADRPARDDRRPPLSERLMLGAVVKITRHRPPPAGLADTPKRAVRIPVGDGGNRFRPA